MHALLAKNKIKKLLKKPPIIMGITILLVKTSSSTFIQCLNFYYTFPLTKMAIILKNIFKKSILMCAWTNKDNHVFLYVKKSTLNEKCIWGPF